MKFFLLDKIPTIYRVLPTTQVDTESAQQPIKVNYTPNHIKTKSFKSKRQNLLINLRLNIQQIVNN